MSSQLADTLRSALASPRPTDTIPEITAFIHSYAAELSSFSSGANALDFDGVLQQVLHEDIDQQAISHIQLVLATLDALDKIISTQSIISTWFDLLLRPSLKSRQLPYSAQKHIRNVVLRAMHDPNPGAQELVIGFRNRIMELYLLDTSNISSGDELVDKMNWKESERLQGALYKTNLETILADFFELNSQVFVELFERHFSEPTWRLQLVLLLKRIVTSKKQHDLGSMCLILEKLLPDLIKSLLIDTSSTLFNVTSSLCVQILPHLVLLAPTQIPTTVPMFLLVLQRGLCWIQHPRYRTQSWPHNPRFKTLPHDVVQSIATIEDVNEIDSRARDFVPALHNSLSWRILGTTFDAPGSVPPAPIILLQFLLGLFPCNTMFFLRSPRQYVNAHAPQQFFALEWDKMIDVNLLKQRAAPLLQKLRLPSGLITLNDQTYFDELTDASRWQQCSIANVVGACTLLSASPSDEELPRVGTMTSECSLQINSHDCNDFSLSNPSPEDGSYGAVGLPSRHGFPEALESIGIASNTSSLPPPEVSSSHHSLPFQVSQAISSLQRENLLLKNELNFELWLKAQSTAHLNFIHKDAAKVRSESEADSLQRHKLLQKYRRRYAELQSEFKAHKEQASTSIHELKTWNKTQEDKIAEMRKKERAWSIEASTLKEKNQLREATIEAQNKLIEEAKKRIFRLETEMKAIKPKIERVQDFEARASQLEQLQKVWEEDVQRFNAQSDQMQVMIHDYKHMSLRLASLEAANKELQTMVHSQPTQAVPFEVSKPSQDFVKGLINQIKELEASNQALRSEYKLRAKQGISSKNVPVDVM